MSDDFAGAYLQQRQADPELEAMIRQTREADDTGVADDIPMMRQPAGPAESIANIGRLGRNTFIGLYDSLRNTGEMLLDVGLEAGRGEAVAAAAHTGAEPVEVPDVNLADLAPDFVEEADAFRNRLARNSTPMDEVIQKAAQFALPFMGAMKLMGRATLAKTMAADAITSWSVWEPHEGRFADLLAEIAPDNRLTNAVIDYLASDPEDSDAEGRFKNVLDGQLAAGMFVGTAAGLQGLIRASAKTLKRARAGLVVPAAATQESATAVEDE